MNEVCLPEDLIKEYAAKHPNAPGVTQTQKVFCLAMMMRQDNIEPFEETYRCRLDLVFNAVVLPCGRRVVEFPKY